MFEFKKITTTLKAFLEARQCFYETPGAFSTFRNTIVPNKVGRIGVQALTSIGHKKAATFLFLMKYQNLLVWITSFNVQCQANRFDISALSSTDQQRKDGWISGHQTFIITCYISFILRWFFSHLPLAIRHAIY